MKNNKNIVDLTNITKEFSLSKNKKRTLKNSILKRRKHKRNISNKIIALNNINLSVNKGEFVGLMGPNGAGKSTILKIISNIYKPTSGMIKVRGSIAPFLELMVGFQPDLTGKENLYLYGALLGLDRRTINDKYNSILKFSGVGKFIHEPLKNFSTGMQMRLAFSLTAHADSSIILIDEVLSIGDESFQRKCLQKMHSLNREGKTIIFVSHDLEMIKNNCKYVYLLNQGKIIAKGGPKYVIGKYKNSI